MTTYTWTHSGQNNNDTNFRLWSKSFHDALVAVGMVQTADTGQIDFATVAGPNGSSAGYDIFRFDDTAQATAPLFVKVEYGTRNAIGSTRPACLWITIGTGSNGSGTITGVIYARVETASTGNEAAGTYTGFASCGEGWLAFIPFCGGPGNTPWFTIERSPDNTSIVVCRSSTLGYVGSTVALGAISAIPVCGVYAYATGLSVSGGIPVLVPSKIGATTLGPTTSLAAGSIGPVFPWVVLPPGLAPFQCVNGLSYTAGDAPAGPFDATLGGVTRTYRPIPLDDAHNQFGFAPLPDTASTSVYNSRYIGLAIRWE